MIIISCLSPWGLSSSISHVQHEFLRGFDVEVLGIAFTTVSPPKEEILAMASPVLNLEVLPHDSHIEVAVEYSIRKELGELGDKYQYELNP